jgi:hypothetical protein
MTMSRYKIGSFKWCAEIAQKEAIVDMFERLHAIFQAAADDIDEPSPSPIVSSDKVG